MNEKQKLAIKISDTLESLLSDIYAERKIATGDITPDQQLYWDEYVNKLTGLFIELIEQNAQPIQSRDADDPKLLEFYYTIFNEFEKLNQFYVTKERTATVGISENLGNQIELAVRVSELGRATAQLSTLAAMRSVFNKAWQKLNAVDDDGDQHHPGKYMHGPITPAMQQQIDEYAGDQDAPSVTEMQNELYDDDPRIIEDPPIAVDAKLNSPEKLEELLDRILKTPSIQEALQRGDYPEDAAREEFADQILTGHTTLGLQLLPDLDQDIRDLLNR